MNERSFIEGLLDEVGLLLPADKQAEFVADLESQLLQLFVLNLLDKLPQSEFDALEDFMRDDPEQNEIVTYLSGRVGASEVILADSRVVFREQFLASQKR